MIRRKLVRFAVFGPAMSLAALAGLSILFSAPAAAATPGAGVTLVQWGWWTQDNSAITGAGCLPTCTSPEDPGNMHVQVAANASPTVRSGSVPCPAGQQVPTCENIYPVAATAISAVRYKLASALPFGTDGSTPVANLTLTVAPPPAPQPSGSIQLLACRSDLSWRPAQGGDWQQAASAAAGGCSAGVPSTDAHGNAIYQFAILAGQLQIDGINMSLAIVPPNVANMQPSNIELEAPAATSITLYPPPPGQQSFSMPQQPMPAVQGVTSSGLPTSSFSGAPAPLSTQPATVQQSKTPVSAMPPSTPVGGLTGAKLALVGGLLLALAMGFAAIALDLERLLAPLGQAGGIGRFAKPRAAPPIPV